MHNAISRFHINDSDLQKRDFDVNRKNSRKYVLLSTEFSFIDKEESGRIIECIKENEGSLKPNTKRMIPSGIGHCWFADDSETVIRMLNDITQKHVRDRNIKALPEGLNRNSCASCCGDKREDTI